MDRIAPTRRPEGRNAGTQRWRDLLFVHYEVEPDALRRLLPRGAELDLFEGRAYVGFVPFRMRRIAPPLVPGLLGLDFLETNLRTYVHFRGRDPGVYFFSLDADSRLAVRVARRFFGLPYHDATMRMETSGSTHEYETVRHGPAGRGGPRLAARWTTGEVRGPARPGTLDHFLLERYLLYVERAGELHVGQVHHVPYPACEVTLHAFEQTLGAASGLVVRPGAPDFVHASHGVDVEVFSTRPAR